MSVELQDIRRGPGDDRYTWTPFGLNDQFNGDWWDSPPYLSDDPHFVLARAQGIEVARVELDYDFRGSLHVGAPDLGASALEIQFIEVAAPHRRHGFGAEVVERLAATYPDRHLLAMSEGADEFWSSLGWNRYDYWEGPIQYRPLFIQP